MDTQPESFSFHAKLGDRTLFPGLRCSAYLNHAGVSPASAAVVAAATEAMRDHAELGANAVLPWAERREHLRAQLAELIGADAQDIGFVQNTSSAVAAVALCFPWRRGDRIALCRGDFPANITPWQQAAALFELEICWLDLKDFERGLAAGMEYLSAHMQDIRLIAVSAVRFQTGLRLPLPQISALCRSRGTQLFVDGIQALGATPVSVSDVDYLASGGHKHLMGLMGSGFLYVDPSRISELQPRIAGWLSHEEPLRFLSERNQLHHDRPIRKRTDFIEQGAVGVCAFAALEAAVALIAQLGVDAIYAHAQEYLDALEPQLESLGFTSLRSKESELRSTSLCLRPPAGTEAAELVQALWADGDGVAAASPDGQLRLAPHFPNSLEELPLVVDALHAALRRSSI
ncbi:MAG: aminotransferase class V-fold PLP-dependent enzyme [Myxococcota bacterium]